MIIPESAWRRYVLNPIFAQLRQGITPEQIALTLAVGTVLGIFPVVGATTILCTTAGIVLRLNQPILQLVNYVLYPVQLALIIVFIRIGEQVYGAEPIALSLPQLIDRFRDAPVLFFKEFATTFLHCITAWLILTPFMIAVLYFVTRPLLHAAAMRMKHWSGSENAP